MHRQAAISSPQGSTSADDESSSTVIEDPSGKEDDFKILPEAATLFGIAAPTIVMQLSLFFTFPMAASAVGRVLGTTELAAFSLGSLIGNLTCLSILEGALSAADTLMPRAYGVGRYEEVGRLAVRGSLVCILMLLPPMLPLCFMADSILVALGQDPDASLLAQEWIRVYFLGVPPNLVFRVLMRFLLAQHQPWPLVVSSAIPCIFIHPLLLRHFVPTAGLCGSAMAIVITQWCTATILVGTLRVFPRIYKAETWPGISKAFLNECLRWKPLKEFFELSIGGIFSMIEWWFFETMCFIAGSFGIVALCAHTIAYNIVPLVFMLPLGILIGLTVRMGHLISEYPTHAKRLAAWCMLFTTLGLGTTVVILLSCFRRTIIASFTDDVEVMRMALALWPHLCAYLWLLHVFAISQAILRALGMQWRLAFITSTFLYLVTLPLVVYFAMVRGGGLLMLWTILPVCYAVMQAILAAGYLTVNWEEYSAGLMQMSQPSIRGFPVIGLPTEETALLPDKSTAITAA